MHETLIAANLPSDREVRAIRRRAAELQAAHLKAIIGRIGAFFSRARGGSLAEDRA